MGNPDRKNTAAEHLIEYGVDVLPFSFAILLVNIYFKISFLRTEGLQLVTRFLTESDIPLLNYVPLFASDVTAAFIFLPLLLIPATLLSRRQRPYLFFLVIELVFVAEILAKIVYHEIGRFPTAGLVVDFIQAYRSDPSILQPPSLEPLLLLKFGFILATGIVALIVSLRLQRRTASPRIRTAMFTVIAGLIAAAGITTAWIPMQTLYHVGYAERLVREFVKESGTESLGDLAEADMDMIKAYYDKTVYPDTSDAPPSDIQLVQANIPAGKRPDVLWIVLETASYQDYPLHRRDRMPRIAELVPHSLVAERHFSSAGYSIRADFSLYTSIYDGPGDLWLSRYLARKDAAPPEALPRILRKEGYATHYHFAGKFLWKTEEWMIHSFGFEEVITGDEAGAQFVTTMAPKQRVLNEKHLFDRAAHDLEKLCRSPQPYFMAVRSLIGHAPIINPYAADDNDTGSREQKIQVMARFIDTNVGQLIDVLRKCERFEETIFMITGDHGIRTRSEDPSFNAVFLDERTFHVPLLIHYPPTFPDTVYIDYLTSHIDLVPTILVLGGLDPDRYHHQGRPLFDQAIRDRVTMFIGADLSATNGLHYRGHFYLEDRFSGLSFLADRFHFNAEHLADPATGEAAFFSQTLRGLERVRQAWARQVVVHAESNTAAKTAVPSP